MLKVGIDLFAGTGGFSHGWIKAGGVIAVAVDEWDEALQNHEHNHPGTPTLKMRLGQHSIEYTAQILKRFLDCFHGEEIHLHIHGSPPCQALSNASNTNAGEGMNLVNWFLELVAFMKPDSWSMENVLPVASRLPEEVPYVRVNSADFGVPQVRKRIYAGEGWTLTPSHSKEEWLSVNDVLPNINNMARIVSRRRKAGEKPQFYFSNQPAHTITQVCHIFEDEKNKRSMKINEASIIQGWNDLKFIPGLKNKDKRLMISNMVNPPIAKAICEGFNETVLCPAYVLRFRTSSIKG